MKRIFFIMLFLFSCNMYCNPVVVGVLGFAPPFSLLSGDKNNSYGFSIDLMNAICKQIDIQCIYKPIRFLDQENILNQGDVDLVFTFTPIPSKNDGNYIFSLPCFSSNGQFMTLQDSGIKTLADLKNKKIGVVSFSVYRSIVQANREYYNEIIQYTNLDELIPALANKQVDAIILDYNFAVYVFNSNIVPGSLLIGEKIPAGNGYGIFTLKKNADLIRKINSALLNIEADGTYANLYNKYFSK